MERSKSKKISGNGIWRAIYPVLIFQAISIAIQIIIMVAYIIGAGNISASSEYMMNLTNKILSVSMEMTMLVDIIGIIIMAYFLYSDRINSKFNGTLVKFERVSIFKYLLVVPFSIAVMLAANYFVNILVIFMPESMSATYAQTEAMIGSVGYLEQFVIAGLVAPICEEMIYRGVVYNRFKVMTGVVGAAIFSSIIFGVIHMNFIQAPYAFLVGIAAVYVYEKYKSLVAPIILHITANTFSTIISYINSKAGVSEEQISEVSSMKYLSVYAGGTVAFLVVSVIMVVIIEKIVKSKEIM